MEQTSIQHFVKIAKQTMIIKGVLKDVHDMTINHLKILTYLSDYEVNEDIKIRPLRRQEGWNDAQMTQLLTYLQSNGWFDKKRYYKDERQIVINLNASQQKRIHQFLNEINQHMLLHVFEEHPSLTSTYGAIRYYFDCVNRMKRIQESVARKLYTLDEMIILSMLLTNEDLTMSVKSLKIQLESNTVKVNKIVKRLVTKDIIVKGRSPVDERVVQLTIREEAAPLLRDIFTSILEKEMCSHVV
ncbi:transcriptional regulator, SarA/Rot family [Staphylococcus massiliensis]|uniref:Accessory regulator Y n=1 Tax=Staphylococcus massiliensis S46 TaxID=1229783 RepID=K9ANU8_9STAP|nr:accessory regulator Y [Staphylococcus massiliensis]EKU48969.1 accessory regulator Y [Staphylococcus massiliensis S46]MCG3399409.1 accessory regulator Y [Staphylococcus massiliensis]MCG3402490.1 accessory regulator Y [Staphylococcus massiliensis]MCG3411545.1 accessory regulator Y [Staphylococcus massiliensis]PNZ97340.1 accessory regulator Y [Staphylococcus massiliensis CCUG 55927]